MQTSTTSAASPAVNGTPLSTLASLRIRNIGLLIVTVAVLLQLALLLSIDNIVASAMVLCGAFVGLTYAANPQLLVDYPLSTLAILGYTLYYFVIPPLGKLSDFQSILHNLNHPILVWGYGLIGLLTLVIAHYVYRLLSIFSLLRWTLATKFYRPLYFFEMPDDLQFWIMGIIGIVSSLLAHRYSSAVGPSVLASTVRVLSPLIYTPYFIAFPDLADPRYRFRRRPFHLGVIIYSIVLLAVAAMVNSRSFMVLGLGSLILLYGYRVFTGTISPPRLSISSVITVLVCLWLISGPIANLAASMLIARRSRGTVSSVRLAKETWNIYRSGIAIRAYEAAGRRAVRLWSYNEMYYNNIFLNRVGNMRLTDLSIDAAHSVMTLGESSYFRRDQFEKVVALLPDPVIRMLQLDIDKKEVLKGSSEDVLYSMATGFPVGGFKTGSGLVIIRMTFGLMWPIYLGLMSIAIFTVFDALTYIGSIWTRNGMSHCVIMNPLVAGTLAGIVLYPAGAQDVLSYVGACTRGVIEGGMVYAVAFVISKFVSSLMLGWAWRASNARQHAG